MPGTMRRSSFGLLPGSSATVGAAGSRPRSRSSSARGCRTCTRSTRGWPTNSTGTPAFRYSASSNGKMTSTRVTNRFIVCIRALRHAQSCGLM